MWTCKTVGRSPYQGDLKSAAETRARCVPALDEKKRGGVIKGEKKKVPEVKLWQYFQWKPCWAVDAYSSVLDGASEGDAVSVRFDGEAYWG